MNRKYSSLAIGVLMIAATADAARAPLQDSTLQPIRIETVWSYDHSRPLDQTLQSATYGPYATMRRAQEVATDFHNRGFNAQAFHNGDGYYVRVWR